jgi:prophage regulatory protein
MSIEHAPERGGVRILRRRQVLEKLNISSTTLWTWIKQGQFPAPFELGPNTPAWLEETVDRHLLERAAAAEAKNQA